jgi:hypothetical protein
MVDDVVTGASPHRGDHGHAAGIVLELATVQTCVRRLGGEARESHVRVTVLGGSAL